MIVSYDTLEIAQKKAQYIISNDLDGSIGWASSSDQKSSNSLIKAGRVLTILMDIWLKEIWLTDCKFFWRRKCFESERESAEF